MYNIVDTLGALASAVRAAIVLLYYISLLLYYIYEIVDRLGALASAVRAAIV